MNTFLTKSNYYQENPKIPNHKVKTKSTRFKVRSNLGGRRGPASGMSGGRDKSGGGGDGDAAWVREREESEEEENWHRFKISTSHVNRTGALVNTRRKLARPACHATTGDATQSRQPDWHHIDTQACATPPNRASANGTTPS
jgi:hypothetical protein